MNELDDIGSISESKCLKHIGSLFYDKNNISKDLAETVYHLMWDTYSNKREIEELRSGSIKLSDITQILERQAELFTSQGSNIDFRKILNEANESNQKYFA